MKSWEEKKTEEVCSGNFLDVQRTFRINRQLFGINVFILVQHSFLRNRYTYVAPTFFFVCAVDACMLEMLRFKFDLILWPGQRPLLA